MAQCDTDRFSGFYGSIFLTIEPILTFRAKLELNMSETLQDMTGALQISAISDSHITVILREGDRRYIPICLSTCLSVFWSSGVRV